MKRMSYLGMMAMAGVIAFSAPAMAGYDQGEGDITIIHTGDFHGHLVPRPNMRSDATGKHLEGGLARVYTKIQEIRKEDPNALLFHTGDTIQGSAEVLYTRGQAMVDVVNYFGIDAFAPGNWEFVYGIDRFKELFVGPNALAPWNTLAANVKVGTNKNGAYLTPEYIIKEVNGLKVGIFGMTTDRGPQVVGNVWPGHYFLQNANGEVDAEVEKQVNNLKGKVDLIVMLSEMGLANNIRLAEKFGDIDLVLSSDMHEETERAVVTSAGAVVIEEGQDGTNMGKLRLKVKHGRIQNWHFQRIRVNDQIKEDPFIAAKIAEVRRPFLSGTFNPNMVNPFNGSKLKRPIDEVVGYTTVPLHRSNFSGENMPAVIEGSSHDFLTDAFRVVANADIGAIRGFRYGTHVAAGPIKLEDLYHFIPIGPQIAKGTIKGQVLKNQIENAADGSLNPNVTKWTGGWCFNFSGVTMDFDPYAPLVGSVPYALNNGRASNIRVNGEPLVLSKDYTYASYWYAINPGQINVINASNITVLKDDNGEPMDGTEVVVKYLNSLPNKTASPLLNRTTLTSPLPPYLFGFPEVQPLRGAQY